MPKRKKPDDEKAEGKLESLREGPIENEYEHLDEGDDFDDDDNDDDGVARNTKIKKDEYEQILHAQEPATVAQDGDIKFTPFNLTEELEEGEFDKAGTFIFKKKDDDEENEGGNDTWAESVDWAEVERREKEGKLQQPVVRMDDEEASKPETLVRDQFSCYKDMLRIMRDGETVQKTIRRLGNNIPRRRPYNKNARKEEQTNQSGSNATDKQALEEVKRKLDLIIELADKRLREGDLDIYEKSYEDLEEAINR